MQLRVPRNLLNRPVQRLQPVIHFLVHVVVQRVVGAVVGGDGRNGLADALMVLTAAYGCMGVAVVVAVE